MHERLQVVHESWGAHTGRWNMKINKRERVGRGTRGEGEGRRGGEGRIRGERERKIEDTIPVKFGTISKFSYGMRGTGSMRRKDLKREGTVCGSGTALKSGMAPVTRKVQEKEM